MECVRNLDSSDRVIIGLSNDQGFAHFPRFSMEIPNLSYVKFRERTVPVANENADQIGEVSNLCRGCRATHFVTLCSYMENCGKCTKP